MNQTRTYVLYPWPCILSVPCVHLLIKIKSDQEWEVVVAPPPYEQITGLRQPEFEPVQDKSTPPQVDSHTIEQDDTPIREVGLPSGNRHSCLIATSSVYTISTS